MIEKFEQLVDSLTEKESENLITILTLLLEAWEDDKINCYSEIQDFEITTIYKVLKLFTDERETEELVLES
jgi:hypothetical protein